MLQAIKMDPTTGSQGTHQKEDKLTKAIGEFGRWQIVSVILFSITVKMSGCWMQMGIIFLAPKTTFRCIGRNSSEATVNSTCYSDCVNYEYYTDFDNTIISEWGLICERAWLANFAQTVSMFGVLIGSILFGFMADRYGRRPALLTASTLQLLTSFVIPFCRYYWLFASVRFLLGAATAGTMVTSYVILVEITGSRYRELMNCIYSMPTSIGEMVMPAFAYYLRAWNKFSIGIAIPNLLFLIYFCFVSESPKWLISVGRIEEASIIMAKAAKCNKLPTENMLEIAKRISNDANVDSSQRSKATYLDLFTVPNLRTKNFLSCVIWFILGLIFYGSNQLIGLTSSNTFVSIAMAGALQIPGILISGYLCKCFGRRITMIALLFVCGICNTLLAVPDKWFYVKLLMGSIAVSSASGAFSSIYMYTTELFPTVARNMAMGASSTVSRVGSMIAPFIAGLSASSTWIPPATFGAVSLIAIIACYYLPETKGKKLPDLITDK